MKIPNKKKLKKPTTQKSKKLSKTPTQKFTRPSSFCYTLLDGRYINENTSVFGGVHAIWGWPMHVYAGNPLKSSISPENWLLEDDS